MNYKKIYEHYEKCYNEHGDSHKGVDWPDQEDAIKRYMVMSDIFRKVPQYYSYSLLDFGCGLSHYYDFLRDYNFYPAFISDYTGMDISEKFINHCRSVYDYNEYICQDIKENNDFPNYDFIVANGVFTEKLDLSYEDMFDFFGSTVTELFRHTKKGLAFNVMSKHVDWERDDLFHVSFDKMAQFIKDNLSKHFTFRQDYGLYEYTTYVFKEKN